jgi:hypothetical protein
MCIPLLKRIWPVTLTDLESEIYKRSFALFMNKKQFKHFIRNFDYDVYRADKSQIVSIDQNFKRVYYIAKISEGYEVHLIGKHDLKLKKIDEGSWLGILEYKDYEEQMGQKLSTEDILWRISVIVHKTDGAVAKGKVGVVVYEFPLKKLDMLFKDKTYPNLYFKAVNAIWLDYTAHYLATQDINLIEYTKFITERQINK